MIIIFFKIYNKIKSYVFYIVLNILFFVSNKNKNKNNSQLNKNFVDTGFCQFKTPGLSHEIKKNFQDNQFKKNLWS